MIRVTGAIPAARFTPRGQAWVVIHAKARHADVLSRRRCFPRPPARVVAAPFFVIRAVQIYAAANFPQARRASRRQHRDVPPVSRAAEHLGLLHLRSKIARRKLIANDRRANALQLYLSKPLTRVEYGFGKLVILAAFLLLVTWVPAIVLLILQVMFAGNVTFLRANLFLFPAITLFSFSFEVLAISATMLALSSLSNSSRFVGILYTGLIFFTTAVWGVLAFALGLQHTEAGAGRRACRGSRRRPTSRRSATRSSVCRCGTTRRGCCPSS